MTTHVGRQRNPVRWALPFLLLGLLLFPSTCADAAMVHSIFTDPLAMNSGAHRHHASGLSDEQIARHIALGHLHIGDDAKETPAIADEADPCDEAPRVRSLPAELMISLAVAPAAIDQTEGLNLSTSADRFTGEPSIPVGRAIMVDIPPPR